MPVQRVMKAPRRIGGSADVERGTLLDHRDAPTVVAVDDGEEQIFLAVDVVVEAPLEEPDPGGDVLDPGGGVALLVELLTRGVDDLGPPFGVRGPGGLDRPRRPDRRFVLLGGQRHVCSASSAGDGFTVQVAPVGQSAPDVPVAIRVLDTIIQLI